MACANCGKNGTKKTLLQPHALNTPPFGATDIQIYNPKDKTIRRIQPSDWNNQRHKLILFFPSTFTPVCESEMGALKNWIPAFDKLSVDVYAATTDPIQAVQDWYESDPSLRGSNYEILSSYILPARLGLVHEGKTKRASVFVTTEGEVVVQEHFNKVGRSIKELHRMMHGYTTDSYCAEGWEDPSDGFLNNDDNHKG